MTYVSEVLADTPRAYWRMNESSGLIQDSSGNANHAVSSSGAGSFTYSQSSPITSDAAAKSIKYATKMFAVNDHATLDLADLWTVEAWVKRNSVGAAHQIADKQAAAYAMRLGTANQLETLKQDTAVLAHSTTTITNDGNFYHVVGTKNGVTSHLYVNGVEDTNVDSTAATVDTANELHIGAYFDGGEMFDGWICELALYGTALTQARVQAHYAAATLSPGPGDNPPIGLIGRGAGW